MTPPARSLPGLSRSLTWILLGCLVAATAHESTKIVWRSFGANTGCGKRQPESAVSAIGGSPENISSMLECQRLCSEQVPSLACKSVEYIVATGSCRLLPEYVRYTHLEAGSECASITGIDPTDVFVMLPLDVISDSGEVKEPHLLAELFDALQETEVDGFMTDVWWGITEKNPKEYNFTSYHVLFEMARARGWKVQVVTSFHQCGGNVGDSCNIPLPSFVRDALGIWYMDSEGVANKEYVSLFADDVDIGGRTPIDMYRDWMIAFRDAFEEDIGSLIVDIQVGMGPCGELRYPSYPLDRWRFCGVGQFQAFDAYARSSLAMTAAEALHPEWASPPSSNSTGSYNSHPSDTEFFSEGYKSDAGRFFLDWYFSSLKKHGRRVMSQARAVFQGKARMTGKVAGIHWWYGSEAHAAEATAGYYNTDGRNAYLEIAQVLAAEGADMDFTCLEMRDREEPQTCKSDPEGLVRQTIAAARAAGIAFSGENALERYDRAAEHKILTYKPFMTSFTFLRVDSELVQPENLHSFADLVAALHGVRSGESLHGEIWPALVLV